MKKQKIYAFDLDAPLTEESREALETAIEEAAETHETDLEYGWEDNDDSRLHVFIKPVEIEVRFGEGQAELLAAAPLWAKAAFTSQRKAELRALVEGVLLGARLILPEEEGAASVSPASRA
ncbi:hypothetical protein [Neomegalonema sp.]|uniref:hypothetical protein n=1 Tax=Neomegalonema sp. TaxID=2039713 RepID=UPI0026331983|nr:hypothetical protein [Neomegalonema sp.]MDD2867463.1 hypothetical protein [Neomegalonema sp.]